MPGLHQLLSSYLDDHLTGASAGRDLFRRAAASHRGTELGATLGELADEVDEDRDAQLDVMRRLGIEPSRLWAGVGRLVETVGRLKPNATWLRRSPLTDVVEIEALRVAVAGKAAGWEALLAAAEVEPRLDRARLEELAARAHSQGERLRDLHVRTARRRFADAA